MSWCVAFADIVWFLHIWFSGCWRNNSICVDSAATQQAQSSAAKGQLNTTIDLLAMIQPRQSQRIFVYYLFCFCFRSFELELLLFAMFIAAELIIISFSFSFCCRYSVIDIRQETFTSQSQLLQYSRGENLWTINESTKSLHFTGSHKEQNIAQHRIEWHSDRLCWRRQNESEFRSEWTECVATQLSKDENTACLTSVGLWQRREQCRVCEIWYDFVSRETQSIIEYKTELLQTKNHRFIQFAALQIGWRFSISGWQRVRWNRIQFIVKQWMFVKW